MDRTSVQKCTNKRGRKSNLKGLVRKKKARRVRSNDGTPRFVVEEASGLPDIRGKGQPKLLDIIVISVSVCGYSGERSRGDVASH